MRNRAFNEFEAYADSVQDADLRVTLLNLERSYWSLRQFLVGSTHIQFGVEGAGSIAEGAARGDGSVFLSSRAACIGQTESASTLIPCS